MSSRPVGDRVRGKVRGLLWTEQRPRLLAHWFWAVANKGSVSLFPRLHPAVPSSAPRAHEKAHGLACRGTQ